MGAGGSTQHRPFYDSSLSQEDVAPTKVEKLDPSAAGIDLHQIETMDQTLLRHHIPYPMNPTLLRVPFYSKYPFQDYQFVKKIGEGRVSTVFKVTCIKHHVSTTERAAIKEITSRAMTPMQYEDVRYELSLLSQCSHENVVKLLAVYEPPAVDAKLYAVYEYLKGGELFEGFVQAGRYSLPHVFHVCQQLLSALHHLHSRGVIHGNIVPENLVLQTRYDDQTFLQERSLRLVGFDYAESFMTGVASHRPIVRQPEVSEFIAPERKFLVEGKPIEQFARLFRLGRNILPRSFPILAASDVWSSFSIFYFLLTGRFPDFSNGYIPNQFLFPEEIGQTTSDTLKNDFRKALYLNPLHRATTREIVQQQWYLQKIESPDNRGNNNNVDLSHNIGELKLFQRRRRNVYSMFVASGSVTFQKPARFQDQQVLPTLLSIEP